MSTATTGTGTITLGSAATGFQAMPAAADGETVSYVITSGTSDWEAGRGVYTHSGTTLTRADVRASSNAGSAISLTGTSYMVVAAIADDLLTSLTKTFTIAASDETTALTTGTAKVTFRMPFAMVLTDVRASVTTAPTDATLTVDINEGGTTILSTKLTIDSTEKTSTTAATPAVISDASLADDAEITIDIDQVGSTVAGAGLKVTFIGYPA